MDLEGNNVSVLCIVGHEGKDGADGGGDLLAGEPGPVVLLDAIQGTPGLHVPATDPPAELLEEQQGLERRTLCDVVWIWQHRQGTTQVFHGGKLEVVYLTVILGVPAKTSCLVSDNLVVICIDTCL